MKILSSAFNNNEYIPSKYSRGGLNINPPLKIEDVPGMAESLLLILDDPYEPKKSWIHWFVYNIDTKVNSIKEGKSPSAKIITNDNNEQSYGGPDPPPGEIHYYFFRVYALDTILDLPDNSDAESVLESIVRHIIDSALLVGLYKQ